MYLHIGPSAVVRQRDIIGVFDMDNATYSRLTRDFLERAERAGELESVTGDLPKSFLLCEQRGRKKIYLYQFSPATLRGRAALRSLE